MLSDNYIEHFLQNYHEQSSSFLSQTPAQLNQSAVRNDPGGFLTLLGKMYLYDILPTSSLT